MSSSKKTVSSSTFLNLKAHLAKHEEEIARNKAAGKRTIGGVRRSDRPPTKWGKPNKGVNARAARDIEQDQKDRPTIESARAALERKAKIYDKLMKGKSGGLNDEQYGELLVDFDSKPAHHEYESDSDDVDESLTVPAMPQSYEDDPIIEYEDEFGRARTSRRSEVPRHLLPERFHQEGSEDVDEDLVIRNPVNHFPIYVPSEERMAEIAKAQAESEGPLDVHYDAAREVRAKGAAFYQFSKDEQTRLAQIEQLKAAREETMQTRQESGAVDVQPGEDEGMKGKQGGSAKSRAMEKRKREIEERRMLLAAKRRKLPANEAEPPANKSNSDTASPTIDPMSILEQRTKKPSELDATPVNEADAFLAQIESEMLKKGRK